MLSQLSRIGTNFVRPSGNIMNITKRNICWIKHNNGIFTIGLTKDTIDTYEGIDSISINKNTFVKFDEELCFIESAKFVESINSPFDCKIVERNSEILNYINVTPEIEETSWIIKIEPVLMNNSLSLDVVFSIDTLIRLDRQTLKSYFSDFGRIVKEGGYLMLHIPDLFNINSIAMSYTPISRIFFYKLIKKYFNNIIFTNNLHNLSTFLIAKRNSIKYEKDI